MNGAAQGQFDMVDYGTFGDLKEIAEAHAGLEGDIDNSAAFLIVEMTVVVKVRAIPAGLAVKMHLFDDAVLG